MKFVSTRSIEGERLSASEAILKGLAADGGLFIPEEMPSSLPDFTLDKGAWYAMYTAMKPFFDGDELEGELERICRSAFDFPIAFHTNDGKDTLELFYGPTAAFKDFGARFLAYSMETLLERRNEDITILVATSGDTGGAVASAFHGRSHISVKVLFPKGRVAERQRRQLTGWDGNVSSYEVEGSFDDCQRMVKEAFMDPDLIKEVLELSYRGVIHRTALEGLQVLPVASRDIPIVHCLYHRGLELGIRDVFHIILIALKPRLKLIEHVHVLGDSLPAPLKDLLVLVELKGRELAHVRNYDPVSILILLKDIRPREVIGEACEGPGERRHIRDRGLMDTGRVSNIDREDDIRAHIAGEVYREIILDAAIDNPAAVLELHGSEHDRDGHRRTQGLEEGARAEHDLPVVRYIRANAPEWYREIIEIRD